jgi:3-methylcrotonyl-CoA carboxylase alpha subunit
MTQSALNISGHAVEARVYAEDPDRGFLPATGNITHLRQPADTPHVRVDTGVREGDEISINYDPMIAKVIAWDVDRPSALRRLRGALGEYEIVGPKTNVSFLLDLSAHRAFAGADVEPSLLETGLIERYRAELFPDPEPASDMVLSLAVFSELLHVDDQARDAAAASSDPYSPWHRRDGWRLNQDNHHTFAFIDRGQRVTVTAHYRESGYLLELPGSETLVSGEHAGDNRIVADLDGVRINATVVREAHALSVFAFGTSHRLEREHFATIEDEEPGLLVSPLPGSVAQVLVEPGQRVDKGQPLMIVEAMKMEHTISAPHAGRVAQIYFALGEQVAEGAQLLAIEET